ncbi:MAG: hypothetical protein HY717_11620 [Planctomycetes bacterium]|nr:hypothetical protein [Planctomycetota bacterium]
MILEREKGVLRSLAKRYWKEKGPGILIGRIENSLILEAWIPLERIQDQAPEEVRDYLRPEVWSWLRKTSLADRALKSAGAEAVPVVFCLPLPRTPFPEVDCFAAGAIE